MALEVAVSFTLPRDSVTVPVVRHLCADVLSELGVMESCRNDILLALSEACTNVIDHSTDDHPYQVHVCLDEHRCTVRVEDRGSDLDPRTLEERRRGPAAPDAEAGRGISLMQALVDDVRFSAERHDGGLVVHLEKDLEFDEGHPVRERLAAP